MSVFAFLLDSRPLYAPSGDSSLLMLPCGGTTVGGRLAAILSEATRRAPSVIRPFASNGSYGTALQGSGIVTSSVLDMEAFRAGIGLYEPSDWLLIVDPRCMPLVFDPEPLFGGLDEAPRIVRHLVALESNAGGTNERVEFDAGGRVRRVQRYYDAVTWTVAAGVSASLIPVSTFMHNPPSFSSLDELRPQLGARSAPARDVPMTHPVFDLTTERGLLRLNERTLALEGESRHANTAIHHTARLIGSVAVHERAIIDEHAIVIGPSVIGRGAKIGRNAVVAQSVVAPEAQLPAQTTIRHRVATGAWSDQPIEPSASDWASSEEALPRADHQPTLPTRVYPRIKTVSEAIIAVTALVLLAPLLAIIAVLIKLESRGPIFYGDPREAKDGRFFRCYKFRTMFVGADAAQRDLMKANQVDGPQFKMKHDPRVSRLGRWLRLISLDELPQLFNVAMGQMSLVGPRPSPFRENQTCVPWRDARLSVRPGITGLWQVCRHDRSSGDFHQWIYYDMQYVRHMSFVLDIKILIATVITLGGKGMCRSRG